MSQSSSAALPDVIERQSMLLAVGWATLVGLVATWFVFSYDYLEDDAFIHLEFARNVALGHGFAFDGLVTNGDTAPLWVLLLAAIHGSGLGWVESAKLACLLGLVWALTGLWRVVYDLVPAERGRQGLMLAAAAVTVINPYFAHWSFSGMETVAALGVSLWAIWLTFLARRVTWAHLFMGALLVGVGPLLRPELLLLDAISAPLLLWKVRHLPQETARSVKIAGVVVLVALMTLPVVAWCSYAWEVFGSVVPNTNLAKRGGPILEIAPRLAAVYAAGFPVTLGLLFFVAVRAFRFTRLQPAAVWVLLLWPVVCVAFYLTDHTIVQTRYCLLSMPCMSIALLALMTSPGRERLFRLSVGGMLSVSLVTIAIAEIPHVVNKKDAIRAYAQLSAYLSDHIPPDAPVAVYAIGELAFKSGHPLVDTGGITRRSVVPYLSDPLRTLQWAKANGARYYVSSHPPEAGSKEVFATSVPYLGWSMNPARYRTTERLALYELP